MKILALADGSSWHAERYVSEVRRQGHTALLASAQPGELVDVTLQLRGPFEFLGYLNLARPLAELIERERPDVINAHFASAYGYTAARCRKRFGDCGALWALTVWGSDLLVSANKSAIHRARVVAALRAADQVFADSTFLGSRARQLGARNVHCIPWGIERSHLASDDTMQTKAVTVNPEKLKVIAPRPHYPLYRNREALTELAPLLRRGQATLTVSEIGDHETFTREVQRLGLTDHVRTYSPLARSEYLKLVAEHDILISAAASDSSPVSVIEALALGVAPIVAEHPGLSDILPPACAEKYQFSLQKNGELLERIHTFASADNTAREALLRAGRDHIKTIAVYEENIAETLRRLSTAREELS